MRKIIWYVLVRSRGQPEYGELVREFQQLLAEYVDKALIAEYLALMVIEITSHTELSHYRQVAARLYDNPKAAGAVASNQRLRAAVQRQMEEEGDLLFLTYQLGGKGASIGTEHRLRITVANQEREYARVREQLEQKLEPGVREKSPGGFLPAGAQRERGHRAGPLLPVLPAERLREAERAHRVHRQPAGPQRPDGHPAFPAVLTPRAPYLTRAR